MFTVNAPIILKVLRNNQTLRAKFDNDGLHQQYWLSIFRT